ncbi:CPBP family intramembrane glutamic endopeptidase [Pseudarthrobacter sp. J1763]|uniref:CPBP family intramembrane glutamic endopeptidase n=1 Tax=Pseudarthrobacter sp. J1763 TaxID=3420445 RepID=UPI003D27A67D
MATLQLPTKTRLYRFSKLDAAAIIVYLGLSVGLSVGAPWLAQIVESLKLDPYTATYAVNLVFYLAVGAVALVAARHVVARDARILAQRPGFTVAMVPLAVVAMLILTAVLVIAGGVNPGVSVNQQGLEDLTRNVPLWLMGPVLVIIGPFVEEYMFRHLLIGKLSQKINVWICAGLSVVLFAGLHVVGKEALSLTTLLPYVAMGITLVGVYLWTGKNVMFSYLVHAAKNLMAVVILYSVPVEMLQR